MINNLDPIGLMNRILIVDDDPDILFLLQTIFKRESFEVAVSDACDDGLSLFYSFRPHAILLDVNVGSSDGRVMCRTIKSKAEHAHIPIVLISASAENLKSYADHGANSVMEKPFDLTKLVASIRVL